jgi:hypothetical protein
VTPERRANGAHAQPVGLLIVGLVFLCVGAITYPAFIGAGVAFTIVGLRGMRDRRNGHPED